ncbi:O-antigen biosynthesis protein [Legionella busanensis]|uniref:O-antigen biosynthesis protein n=1 Tax=Legionella busanensis TaxID=190655 RepID=A0A378JKI5_9GAMM|nr:O-antigen ligase family protein [Legionella busanensis]STX51198.1 O-antigen biosynthesis protein [Legionella busanensis]
MAIAQLSWPRYITKESVTFLLTALLFAIPISSSGKSIFVGLAVATILISANFRAQIKNLLTHTWCKALLLFVLIALLGCIWSPASIKIKLFVIEKYSKLLYLPIFLVGFQNEKARNLGVHAFLLAMLLTAFLSIAKDLNILTSANLYSDHVFRNHIMTSMMMGFATYLAGYLFFKRQGYSRFAYGILIAIYSYQILFINAGRLGYILYVVLISLLAIQMLNKRQAIMGVFSILLLFGFAYKFSPIMQVGITALSNDFKYFQQNKDTPIGFRLQFHSFAKELFKREPLIGNGTGSFIHYFSLENPVPGWGHKLLEPHSQYWLTAAEFGLLGLLSYAILFLSLFKASLTLREWRFPAIALLILISIGNFSDSLLFYSGSGYFFIVLMALFLSEKQIK